MNNYFEVKIQYNKDTELGPKKTTEVHLIDALTHSEAEAKINKEFENISNSELKVVKVNPSKIEEVHYPGGTEQFYLIKIRVTSINETTGKESYQTYSTLIGEHDFVKATQHAVELYNNVNFNWEIISASRSSIINVIEHIEAEADLLN